MFEFSTVTFHEYGLPNRLLEPNTTLQMLFVDAPMSNNNLLDFLSLLPVMANQALPKIVHEGKRGTHCPEAAIPLRSLSIPECQRSVPTSEC